eukprot:3268496-Pyramimonas_sp.AAC.1
MIIIIINDDKRAERGNSVHHQQRCRQYGTAGQGRHMPTQRAARAYLVRALLLIPAHGRPDQ